MNTNAPCHNKSKESQNDLHGASSASGLKIYQTALRLLKIMARTAANMVTTIKLLDGSFTAGKEILTELLKVHFPNSRMNEYRAGTVRPGHPELQAD
jgi:hypothetical protein